MVTWHRNYVKNKGTRVPIGLAANTLMVCRCKDGQEEVRQQAAKERQQAFRSEKRRLDSTAAWFDEHIEGLKNRNEPSTGDPRVDKQIIENQRNTIRMFEGYRSQPYVGRLDYLDDSSGKTKTAYIGSFNSRAIVSQSKKLELVVERQDSGLAEAFDNPTVSQYMPARGADPIPIRVLLKRVINVENGRLLDIEDVYEHDSASGAGSADEYESLSKVDSPVLLVQTAAGSGSSLLLRRRLDYLMSPFSSANDQARPSADKVALFGPTQPYMDSVRSLVSELNVGAMQVTTVSGWMAGQFRSRVTARESDGILDSLMSGEESPDMIEAQRFKGELPMKSLLDRFIDERRKGIRATAEEFVSYLPSDLASSKRAVSVAFREHPEPNVARHTFIEGLTELWLKKNEDPDVNRNELKRRAVAAAEDALSFWPELDTFAEYASLMSNPTEILRHSRGKTEKDMAYKVSLTAPKSQARSLAPSDLAAALYLDHRLNGYASEMFEHVVIGEAQDVSPMEIELIRMHSSDGRFSIFGDLNQRLLPHRGLPNWNMLRSAFGRPNVHFHQMRQAHSATKQITLHNNRILKSTAPGVRKPTPSERAGRTRRKRRSENMEEMRQSLLRYLRSLLRLDDVVTVGVLTKRHQTALSLSNFLKRNGVENVHYLAKDGAAEKGVTLAPVLLARGLEFDAVIVANVDEHNFSDTDFNRTLLYLACSRARNYLELHIQGTEPAIVP